VDLGIVVADHWQGMGLGTALLRRLVEVARCEGIRRIKAEIFRENAAMLALAEHFHFELARNEDPEFLTGTLALEHSSPVA
jgi:acetyltransferase